MNYLQRKKRAFMSIVNSIKGFIRTITETPPITLYYCVDDNSVINYQIYGNSMQDGEPSPDNPIEIKFVGDYDSETGKYRIPVTAYPNDFNVNDLDTMIVDTYYCLPFQLKPNTKYVLSLSYNSCSEYIVMSFGAGYGSASTKLWISHKTSESLCIKPEEVREFTTTDNGLVYICTTYVADVEVAKERITKAIKGLVIREYDTQPITTNIYLDEPLRKVRDYVDCIAEVDGDKAILQNIFEAEIIKPSRFTSSNLYNKLTNVVRIAYALGTPEQKQYACMLSPVFKYNGSYLADEETIVHRNTSYTTYYVSLLWERLGLTYDGTNAYRTDDTTQTALTNREIHDIASTYIDNLPAEYKKIYMVLNIPKVKKIQLPNLPTFKGNTTYVIGTTTQPSDMVVEYYSTVKGD